MVISTRKRCYRPEDDDLELSTHRPLKRGRIRKSSAHRHPTRAERSSAILSRDRLHQGLLSHVTSGAACSKSRIEAGHMDSQAGGVYTKSQLALPFASHPAVFEDSTNSQPDPRSGPQSPRSLLAMDRHLDNSNTLEELVGEDQKGQSRKDSRGHKPAEITATMAKEAVNSTEHSQLRYPTPPLCNEENCDEGKHGGISLVTMLGSQPMEDAIMTPSHCRHSQDAAAGGPPPSAPCSPKEHAYDYVNPNFGDDVIVAYKASVLRDGYREYKYGPEIANMWKRGSTPVEARESWDTRAARNIAEVDQYSDSD